MFNVIPGLWIFQLLLILGCGLCLSAEEEQPATKRANIDVLVVFDSSAREYIFDRKRNKGDATLKGKAETAIEEINQVIKESGLDDFINFRCSGIFELDYTTQAGECGHQLDKDLIAILPDNERNRPLKGTLTYHKKKTTESPEEVTESLASLEEAMANSQADLAIMFVWYKLVPQKPSIQGLSTCYNIDTLTADYQQPSRHAVFNIETLNTASATFSHEVCHLLGAGHADMLYLNPGPQSETDAAAALCYTNDGRAHTSLMGYVAEYDTRKKELNDAYYKDAVVHKVLSGPTPFVYNKIHLPLGNQNEENNSAVILRHASVISLYHNRGDEIAINDDFSAALPLPPLTCWKDKRDRLLRAKALSEILRYVREKHGREFKKKLCEYWKDRERIIQEIVKEKELEREYISPALPKADDKLRLACLLGTTTGATREEGEPKLKDGYGNTVWYKVTPSVSGEMELSIRKINTTAGFEPVMAIFQGNSLSELQKLPISEISPKTDKDKHFLKRIKVTVKANQTLHIAIDNKIPLPNQFNLLVTLTEKSESTTALPSSTTTAAAKPECPPDSSVSKGTFISKEEQYAPTDISDISKNQKIKPTPQVDWLSSDTAILTFAIGCITAAIISAIQIISSGLTINPEPLVGKIKDKNIQFGNIQIGAPKRLRAPITRKDRKFVLRATLSNGKKKSYSIAMKDFNDNNEFTVGSDSSNSLVIRDKTVEKKHCVFKIRHVENNLLLIVADLGTETGTVIDNIKLTIANASVQVTDGSELVLGDCHFKITTTPPSMFKVLLHKFARFLRLIFFIISLIFSILAVIVLYESRKEREAKDYVGADRKEQNIQPEEGECAPAQPANDKHSTLIVIDTESDAVSPKIKYIDLGTFQQTDEIIYNKPDSEGTLRICRVPLPDGALNWTQPMQEPSCGDIISISLLEEKKYTFEVTSVDIEEKPYKKIVVHGKLQNTDGYVTMMLLDKRLLMQIEDTNPNEPRVYNVSFAEEYTDKDGPETYLVQEIDPRLVARSTPMLLTEDSPAEKTTEPTNSDK